jgi:hypothetical protein
MLALPVLGPAATVTSASSACVGAVDIPSDMVRGNELERGGGVKKWRRIKVNARGEGLQERMQEY